MNDLRPPLLTSNGIYCLCWYSPKDKKIVGFEDMPKLTSKKVRKWFSLADDDSGIYCYVVTACERQHLNKLAKTEIDLNKYEYFVECHKVSSGKYASWG